MIRLVSLALAALLSGCGIASKLENVPVCSLTNDRALVISMYGPLGFATEVTERYVQAMCPLVGYPQPSQQPGLKPPR
jgi:hypothetical protein